jgi:hypothetical protein
MQRESHPPVLVNVSLAIAATEADNVSTAVTAVQPESNTDCDTLTTSYVNTTTESSQTSQTNGTLMQRNKIKEVMLQSCRLKRGEIIETVAL